MKLEKLEKYIPTMVNLLTVVVLFYILPMAIIYFITAAPEFNPINLHPGVKVALLLYWGFCIAFIFNKLNPTE